MPFDSSLQVNPTPDVRIFFEGLLILVPAQDAISKLCEVYAINHHSTEHEVFVDVSIDEPQPTLPILRIGGKVIQSGLEIATTAPAGVKKFEPNTTPTAAPFPFHEVMDLKVLNPSATLNPGGLHPAIKIRDGVLYSASHRTSDVSIESQNTTCRNLSDPLSLIIGTSIDLNGRNLRLTWGSEYLELPGDGDGSAKYIIWITNSRTAPPPPNANDFGHFYHGLNGVDPRDQFSMKFGRCGTKEPEQARGERVIFTTPRVPCIPADLGG
jgi:hypothetical protein